MRRLLAVFAAILVIVAFVTEQAYASGNILLSVFWRDAVDNIITEYDTKSYESESLFAKQISTLSGNVSCKVDGVSYYAVMVVSKEERLVFVNGKELGRLDVVPVGANPPVPPNIDPSKNSALYGSPVFTAVGNTKSGTKLEAEIYVFRHITADVMSKVVASVDSKIRVTDINNPNIGSALRLVDSFSGVINLVLGMIVAVIGIGVTLFTSIDIMYIAFPAFREGVDTKMASSGKGTKSNKDGSKGHILVTDDAITSVKEAHAQRKQPWGIYLRKRVVALCFLAIVLTIFMSGNIFTLTSFFYNIVQGFFSLFNMGE